MLVTGGAGFIGGHLVSRLVELGHEVTVLDDLSTGRADRLTAAARLIKGDICDAALVESLTAGTEMVIHLAARVSVQDCIADWSGGHRVNLVGTINVLEAARRKGGVPVIYASSAAVYGERSGPCGENDLPCPISPYGADKLGCEHQASAMAAVHGLASIGLRFFNVYGPGQDAVSPYAGVIAKFFDNRTADRGHVVFGDGGQSRDFIHVSDVVTGIILAADAVGGPGLRSAAVFNLCTGRATTLLALAAEIDRAGGRATPIRHQPPREGDIRSSLGDPTAASEALGFDARVKIGDGLADLWATFQRRQAKGSSG